MVQIRSLHSTLILNYLAYCVLVWGHTCGTDYESTQHIDIALSSILCVGMGTHLWYTLGVYTAH